MDDSPVAPAARDCLFAISNPQIRQTTRNRSEPPANRWPVGPRDRRTPEPRNPGTPNHPSRHCPIRPSDCLQMLDLHSRTRARSRPRGRRLRRI